MTSKITAIQAAMIAVVDRALGAGGYQRIPNPYLLEANSDVVLEKGYGVAVGPGQREDVELGRMYMRRLFNVALVRVIAATDHDVVGRDGVETALLEDLQAIRLELERNDPTLQGLASTTDYESDAGLQLLVSPSAKFYSLHMTWTVLYQDSI